MNEKLLTLFAVGFAGFAAWWVLRPKLSTSPGVGATNYTPALAAVLNRNPVDASPVQRIDTSELAFWHEKEPWW